MKKEKNRAPASKAIKIVAFLLGAALLALVVFYVVTKDKNPDDSNTPAPQTPSSVELVLGFDSEFPPMGFLDENTNTYVGFDLDLAKEAAKRLNYTLTLQPINWDTKDSELSSGNIDMIWNGFTMHTEDNGQNRDDLYTWTDAYMKNAQVIVVRQDSDIASAADLAGKTVATQKQSSGLAALNDNPEVKNSLAEVIETKDYESALTDLETGAVDAVVMDETVIGYRIAQGNSFKIVGEPLADEEYGVAFLLGNTELRDKVQGALEEMAADGTMAQISNKWFSRDVTVIGK